MPPVRMAIVGVGKIARDQHLPAITGNPAFKLALARDKHVLLEKPPCTSLAQAAHRTLYQTWHSRHALGVAPAARLLRQRKLRRVRVTWKEDVRRWHPGQTWIWQAGGFGVLDPGINAFSILTQIIAEPIFAQSALLFVPSNCEAPIAADIELVADSAVEAFDMRAA